MPIQTDPTFGIRTHSWLTKCENLKLDIGDPQNWTTLLSNVYDTCASTSPPKIWVCWTSPTHKGFNRRKVSACDTPTLQPVAWCKGLPTWSKLFCSRLSSFPWQAVGAASGFWSNCTRFSVATGIQQCQGCKTCDSLLRRQKTQSTNKSGRQPCRLSACIVQCTHLRSMPSDAGLGHLRHHEESQTQFHP